MALLLDLNPPEQPDRRDERYHPEEKKIGDHRSPAERDRDRILYTSAFRRLAEVTQVVAANNAHVFHNRLTHSLQVAQVGCRIAELHAKQPYYSSSAGAINPDVVEAASLAHDLGHPPFGHIAEQELNSLCEDIGGFEGNAQSFRIVTKLAFRSPDYAGINLTRATLCALLKYPWRRGQNPAKPKKWGAYNTESDDFNFARELMSSANLERSAEAELMDWADDVTYCVHDLEDFYRAGRIPLHLLAWSKGDDQRKLFFDDVFRRRAGESGIWSRYARSEFEEVFTKIIVLNFRNKEPYNGSRDHRARLRSFTGRLIGRYVNAIELRTPGAPSDHRIVINEEYLKEVAMLKELTWTYVIEAPALATQQRGQREIIRSLFRILQDAIKTNTNIFPIFYREQLKKATSDSERTRLVLDLISGMTERQAVMMYQQLLGITVGSGLESILI